MKASCSLQELKGHAAAKAQGQNNKRTYAKVANLDISMRAHIYFCRRSLGVRPKNLLVRLLGWRWCHFIKVFEKV